MTTMEKSMEHICDAGLFLALGQFDHPLKLKPSKAPTTKLHHNLEPSLTLGLSNDAYHSPTTTTKEISNLIRQSSCPHSITNSCLSSPHPSSVKREINEEEEEGSARKKLRLTKEQSAILEDKFKEHTTLTPIQKQALAKQLNLRPRQVEVWFQNRRARTKLKQTEVDCEILKRCCETLSEENKKLYKELEELKALKVVSQPVYMQLPHTTLTVCPSCERVVTPNKSQFKTNNPFQHSAAC